MRRIVGTEWEELRALRLRALRSDPLAFGSTVESDAARDPSHWPALARRGAEGAEEGVWVATARTDGFVGMIGGFPDQGTTYVWGMWVDPAYRGTGLGGRLLDALLDWAAKDQSSKGLRLTVNPAQVAAARMYADRGFVPTGREEPVWHTPGLMVREMVRPGRLPRAP